jgi:hypothetical protein
MTPSESHAAVHATVAAQLESTRDLLYWAQYTTLELKDPKLLGKRNPGWHDWPKVERLAEYAIRACEADLERVVEHAPEPYGETSEYGPAPIACSYCQDNYDQYPTYPCREVLRIARAYSVEVSNAT